MPSEAGQEFGDPASYPYMTVASPSCHDTSTTRAWWEQDAGRRERFYYQARLGRCAAGSPPSWALVATVRVWPGRALLVCPSGVWAQVLGRQGDPPAACTPEIMREIVKQHLDAPSMWAIFPLQVRPTRTAQ